MRSTTANEQCLEPIAPLQRCGHWIDLSLLRSRRRAQLGRDGEEGRRHFVVVALQHQFLDHTGLGNILGQPTNLARPLGPARQPLGTRHIRTTAVVGDFHAVLQEDLLRRTAFKNGRHFQGIDLLAHRGITPARHAAQDVQFGGRHTHLHLNPLRQTLARPGVRSSPLENDNIGDRLLRANHVERNVFDALEAVAAEGDGVVLLLRSDVEATTAVGREGPTQINDAEAIVIHGHVGQQIPQSGCTQGIEALGHERAPRRLAVGNVGNTQGVVGRRVAQDHFRGILTLDDAIELIPRLGLHADADEIRFNHAVRVHDVNEQVGRTVGSHAVEVGSQIAALTLVNVAAGAVGGVDLLTVGHIARLLHFRLQLGDEGVLFLGLGPLQVVDDLGGAGRDLGVTVGTETVQACRSEQHHVDLVSGERLDEGGRGVGPLEYLSKGRLQLTGGQLGESLDQSHSTFGGGTQGLDERFLERRTNGRGHQRSDGRDHRRIDIADTN